ncbi:centrin [Trypanosoma rangeli]|uniref:Centrin n=1 Tax=Trypanosoma rangeli TaxID=5698 RepID=A0A3R7KFP2_TRYRA|nr:centrin [Trypanosoma rangeli]RNF05539.1 centrin [Trypanosoma rangeli]|eukprot:RNF05539.1 centrin [Trypanosoma rangeli]
MRLLFICLLVTVRRAFHLLLLPAVDFTLAPSRYRTLLVEEGRVRGKLSMNNDIARSSAQRLLPDLSESQRAEIAEAFRILDVDGTETITPNDLKVVLRALGYEPQKDAIKELVAEMDKSGVSSNLILPEFEAIMKGKFFAEDSEEVLLSFPHFTKGNSDYITLDDLKRVAEEVGEDMPEDVLKAMIKEADVVDHDQRVSKEEFLRMLLPPKDR